MVNRPVCLGVRFPSGTPRPVFLLISRQYGFVGVRGPLWQEVRSAVYRQRSLSRSESHGTQEHYLPVF
jgi:hypothetical protein